MKIIYSHSLLIFLISSSLAWATTLTGQNNPLVSEINSESLIDELKQGGYIIYIRHAATDHNQTDSDRTNLNDCTKQRNLSKEGKSQSLNIGKAFKQLAIPVGNIISSPYCRCRDTANLAFGKSTISNDLRFALGTNEDETRMLSNSLKKMLMKSPDNGKNTILVSHTANLEEAANVWPKPEGVSIIFKPGNGNGFSYIGKILPGEWNQQDFIE